MGCFPPPQVNDEGAELYAAKKSTASWWEGSARHDPAGRQVRVARQIHPDSVVAGATTFFEVQVCLHQSLSFRRDTVCQRRLAKCKKEKEARRLFPPQSGGIQRCVSQRLGWYLDVITSPKRYHSGVGIVIA